MIRNAIRALVLMLPLVAVTAGNTQSVGTQSGLPQAVPPASTRRPGVTGEVPTDDEVRMEREMARQRNKERQESLKRDTDKLFELATQLKESVDKSNENTLSLDVVRRAEQIEKLAHSVREKMKGQ